MGRESAPAPEEVAGIAAEGRSLSWTAQSGDVRYAVYKVKPSSVENVYEAALVAVVPSNQWTASVSGNYAVSALNRDNVESAISQPVRVE